MRSGAFGSSVLNPAGQSMWSRKTTFSKIRQMSESDDESRSACCRHKNVAFKIIVAITWTVFFVGLIVFFTGKKKHDDSAAWAGTFIIVLVCLLPLITSLGIIFGYCVCQCKSYACTEPITV